LNHIEKASSFTSLIAEKMVVWYKYCILKPDEYKEIEDKVSQDETSKLIE